MDAADPSALDWLLAGDVSIRWQTQRDLLGRSARTWRASQARVATEGWGHALLALQRPDGHWGRGAYQPKWTCTTYTLQLLWLLGLTPGHPAARKACSALLEEGLETDGGINFWRPRRRVSETCVTGMVLGQVGYFLSGDARKERLAEYLLAAQMPDGGWNCRWPAGATHASFHTTISVLEGLREYAAAGGARRKATDAAAARGREFLLQHQLFKSHTTGRQVSSEMMRLHFPPQWRFDVLRGLDYFQSTGVRPDQRLADAMAHLTSLRRPDGGWLLARGHPGAVHLELEKAGKPSRWNTLRALRVLRWWEQLA